MVLFAFLAVLVGLVVVYAVLEKQKPPPGAGRKQLPVAARPTAARRGQDTGAAEKTPPVRPGPVPTALRPDARRIVSPQADTRKASPRPAEAPGTKPSARTAADALREAEEYEAANRDDPAGAMERYEAVASRFPDSTEATMAKTAAARLRSRMGWAPGARLAVEKDGTIWIEGEDAVTSTFKRHGWYDGENFDKSLLSGSEWLSHFADGAPPEATFEFEVARGGDYVFWLRATPYVVHISFSLDGAEWCTVARKSGWEFANQQGDAVRVGTQEKDPRSVAWTRVRMFSLGQGRHSLTLRVSGGPGGRNAGAIDCMCFTKHRSYQPLGTLKPGERPDLRTSGERRPGKAWTDKYREKTGPPAIQPGETVTVDFESKPNPRWKIEGSQVSEEQAHGGKKSLKLTVGQSAQLVFGEDDDLPVRVSFWIHDAGENYGRKNNNGGAWGVRTAAGEKFCIRQVWRRYLNGDEDYAWIHTSENQWFDQHPCRIGRKAGWSEWVFDFTNPSAVSVTRDGKAVSRLIPKYTPKGAVTVYLLGGTAGPVYVDDIKVKALSLYNEAAEADRRAEEARRRAEEAAREAARRKEEKRRALEEHRKHPWTRLLVGLREAGREGIPEAQAFLQRERSSVPETHAGRLKAVVKRVGEAEVVMSMVVDALSGLTTAVRLRDRDGERLASGGVEEVEDGVIKIKTAVGKMRAVRLVDVPPEELVRVTRLERLGAVTGFQIAAFDYVLGDIEAAKKRASGAAGPEAAALLEDIETIEKAE